MALARVGTLSTGLIDLRLARAIFLLVRLMSVPISSGVVARDVSHPSAPECPAPTSGFDQTAGQSAEENRPSASAPTSAPYGFPCNRSVAVASSATLLPAYAVSSVLRPPVESKPQSRHSFPMTVPRLHSCRQEADL